MGGTWRRRAWSTGPHRQMPAGGAGPQALQWESGVTGFYWVGSKRRWGLRPADALSGVILRIDARDHINRPRVSRINWTARRGAELHRSSTNAIADKPRFAAKGLIQETFITHGVCPHRLTPRASSPSSENSTRSSSPWWRVMPRPDRPTSSSSCRDAWLSGDTIAKMRRIPRRRYAPRCALTASRV